MKRSEMLSKIASVIINYNEVDSVIKREKALEMAETILQVQEEAGMLPPPVKLDCVTSSLLYCYYPKVQEKEGSWGECLDRDNSQLWEEE
jgi:hypothetical protein